MAVSPDAITQGLIARNVSPLVAQAFAAEAGSESGFDPAINERQPLVPGSRGGFGLLQWTGPRRRQLEAFARDQGRAVDDPELQMDFLAWELQNTERSAADRINRAGTVEDARAAIITDFLRPAANNQDRRLAQLNGGTMTDAGPQMTPQMQAAFDAYQAGELPPEQANVIERAIAAGIIPGLQETQAPAPAVPKALIDAYNAGQMSPEQEQRFEALAARGDVDLGEAQGRTVMQSALRQLGLTGRALAQGAAGLADIVYGPSSEVAGLVTGEVPPRLREQVSAFLTDLGVPEPENAVERVVQMAGEAMTGAGAGVAAARGAGALATGAVARGAADVASALPGAQVLSGAGAGGGQQIAAEAGAGPIGQTAAGLAGAVVGGMTPSAARRSIPAVDDATGAVVARPEPPITTRPGTVPPQQTPGPAAIAGSVDDRAYAAAPDQVTLGRLIRKAAQGNQAARQELARVIDVDPRAAEAAAVLDIDMPADVWARNLDVQHAGAGVRGIVGGEAKIEFEQAVRTAAQRADDTMREVVGARNLSAISQDTLDSLTTTRNTLRSQADDLYEGVRRAVPEATPVSPGNAIRLVGEEITNSGGVGNVNAATRQVFNRITDPDNTLTYKALSDLKSDLGRALKGQGPYADANTGTIKRLYAALRADQLEAAGTIGGPTVRNDLRLANQITAKQKGLEERIVASFGKDLDGSIAQKLRTAITQGAESGNVSSLRRLMKVIPKDLQRDAIASALAKGSEKVTSGERGFGFSQFTRLYSGLRDQPAAYKIVADAVGPEGERMLQALYEVSRKIADASNRVSQTGKSAQPILQEIVAEGITNRVINSRGSNAVRMVPFGEGVLDGLSGLSQSNGAEKTVSLLKDPAFQSLVTEAARRPVQQETITKAARSPAFRRWADGQGITSPAQWLQGVVQTVQGAFDDEQR